MKIYVAYLGLLGGMLRGAENPVTGALSHIEQHATALMRFLTQAPAVNRRGEPVDIALSRSQEITPLWALLADMLATYDMAEQAWPSQLVVFKETHQNTDMARFGIMRALAVLQDILARARVLRQYFTVHEAKPDAVERLAKGLTRLNAAEREIRSELGAALIRHEKT